MAGNDEEDDEAYELLSHDEVERLRREAHEDEGDFIDAINTLKRTHESIEDLNRLLGSVKENILEDYAESPNPESLLSEIRDQNEKIAEAMVSVVKRVDSLQDRQEDILDRLDEQQQPSPQPQVQPVNQTSDDQQPSDAPEESERRGTSDAGELDNLDHSGSDGGDFASIDDDFDDLGETPDGLDDLDDDREDDTGFFSGLMSG